MLCSIYFLYQITSLQKHNKTRSRILCILGLVNKSNVISCKVKGRTVHFSIKCQFFAVLFGITFLLRNCKELSEGKLDQGWEVEILCEYLVKMQINRNNNTLFVKDAQPAWGQLEVKLGFAAKTLPPKLMRQLVRNLYKLLLVKVRHKHTYLGLIPTYLHYLHTLVYRIEVQAQINVQVGEFRTAGGRIS